MTPSIRYSILFTTIVVAIVGCTRIDQGRPVAVSESSLDHEVAQDADEPLPPPPPAQLVRAESNVPMTKLGPGQRPPQFILFSFDGVA